MTKLGTSGPEPRTAPTAPAAGRPCGRRARARRRGRRGRACRRGRRARRRGRPGAGGRPAGRSRRRSNRSLCRGARRGPRRPREAARPAGSPGLAVAGSRDPRRPLPRSPRRVPDRAPSWRSSNDRARLRPRTGRRSRARLRRHPGAAGRRPRALRRTRAARAHPERGGHSADRLGPARSRHPGRPPAGPNGGLRPDPELETTRPQVARGEALARAARGGWPPRAPATGRRSSRTSGGPICASAGGCS